MKKIIKIMIALLAVLLAFGVFSGFTVTRAGDAPETVATAVSAGNSGLKRINIAPMADGDDYGTVQTPDGKTIYVNPADGGTYTEDGSIVVDPITGTAVNYMEGAQEFKNAKGDTLTLLERSGGSAKVYDLGLGQHKVRAVKMEDKLYKFTMLAGTAYNRGGEYEMLLLVDYIEYDGWTTFWTGKIGYFEYFDMRGEYVSYEYIKGAVDVVKKLPAWVSGFISEIIAASLNYTEHLDAAYFGTFADVLEEIRIEFEQSDETEGFALNPETGEFLRTDLGDKILLGTNFQLIDVVGWPLIGADAWPVFWNAEQVSYTNYSGEPLRINAKNELLDTGDKIIHSVIQNLLDGTDLYCLYLADGKTYLPATKDVGSSDFYDLNGKKIPLGSIIVPIVAEDERERDKTVWDGIQWPWESSSGGASGCQGTLGWIVTVLIVIGIFIALVLVIKFLKWAFSSSGSKK